jgi:hypothetical protein
MTVQPPDIGNHEFHGSAWNLNPGPVPGCRWEDVVTQKSVLLSQWKIPLHWDADAAKIQNKVFVSETLK